MSEATRDEFYQRLDDAPYAVRGFFETIETRFEPRNSAIVHFTRTNVIDMRIAIPREMTNTGRIRNFATMYWQVKNRVIHSRIFLTLEELVNLGFSGAEEPKSSTEPLNAELRLSEDFWRYKAEDFGRYLEAAHIKMLAQC
ncbi:MAG: hypothetical protein EpisKO_04010 [Epibacterium sp.]